MPDREMIRQKLVELMEADIGESFSDLSDAKRLLEELGLDSVDALQLVVALDKNFGLKVPDPAAAKIILQSVNTIVAAVERHQAGPAS